MISSVKQIGCLILATMLCGLPVAVSQDDSEQIHVAVSLKGQRNPQNAAGFRQHKLAPELRALQKVEGALVGRTKRGDAVITTTKKAASRLVTDSASVGVDLSTEVDDWMPVDRLILSYRDQPPSAASLKKAGLELIEDYAEGTFVIVQPIQGTKITGKTADELFANPQVTKAYPSHRVKLSPPNPAAGEKTDRAPAAPPSAEPDPKFDTRPKAKASARVTPVRPNDANFDRLWGMQRINAPLAWTATTSSPVIVGVIDTGVDYDHPDLRDNMWRSPRGTFGYNALTGSENPMDDAGHGTHCAGTIAAVANNQQGVVGVTWNVKVMGLKFLNSAGEGEDIGAIKCIDYALKNGATVLSNSWGGYGYTPELDEAIGRAQAAGALFIAAAGNETNDNDSSTPHYPSSYDRENVIAVMSIDPNGQPSDFSNFGRQSVDLAAPGREIYSTYPRRRYKSENGTSMATPHVAGAAALVWGHPKFRDADWRVIKSQLQMNVARQTNLASLCTTGGVLNLEFLADGSTPPVIAPPSTPPGTTPIIPPVAQPDPPVTPPASGSAVLRASATFQQPITVTNGRNLLKVRVQLSQPSEVWLQADTSVTSDADIAKASISFLNDENIDRRWKASARYFSVTTGEWTPVSSSFTVNLPAGDHDLFWKLWDEDDRGANLTCNAGTLTVTAIQTR